MNNLKFKKSLLAIATGAALAAAGMTAANAESLLFPYWSTQSGISSILSLTAGPNVALGPASGNIHYVWNYGSSCTHFDNYGTLTPNDLIQQPVAQPPAGTPNWFGDTSTGAYFPNIAGGSYGFLVVTDNAGVAGGAAGPLGSLRGQMVIASASAGVVTALSGIPQTAAGVEGDFSGLPVLGAPPATTPSGGALPAGLVGVYRMSWYPASIVPTTGWYGVVLGNMGPAIAAGANWNGGLNYTNGGAVFGRDEDAYSGSMEGTLTCSGIINPDMLMNSAQQASVTNGGVASAFFTNAALGALPAPANPGTGVVMTKLETIPGPYTFVTGEKAVFGQGW